LRYINSDMILHCLHDSLESLADRYPHVGICATIAGLGASVLTWMKVLTIVFGFGGALIGFIAGYYTFRVQRRKWQIFDQHKHDEK
jgi:hypothetical protein